MHLDQAARMQPAFAIGGDFVHIYHIGPSKADLSNSVCFFFLFSFLKYSICSGVFVVFLVKREGVIRTSTGLLSSASASSV